MRRMFLLVVAIVVLCGCACCLALEIKEFHSPLRKGIIIRRWGNGINPESGKEERYHSVDILTSKDAEVMNVAAGVVMEVRNCYCPFDGLMSVTVSHVDDNGDCFISIYGRLESVSVREGDSLIPGQVIGRVEMGLYGESSLSFAMREMVRVGIRRFLDIHAGKVQTEARLLDGHWINPTPYIASKNQKKTSFEGVPSSRVEEFQIPLCGFPILEGGRVRIIASRSTNVVNIAPGVVTTVIAPVPADWQRTKGGFWVVIAHRDQDGRPFTSAYFDLDTVYVRNGDVLEAP